MVSERDLLGIRRDASHEQACEAYETLKAEWAEVRRQTEDEGLVDKVDAIQLQLATAYARVRLRDRQQGCRETGARPRTSVAGSASSSSRDARLHVQVKDWSGAVPPHIELVALSLNGRVPGPSRENDAA
jgi:hypothetical protein